MHVKKGFFFFFFFFIILIIFWEYQSMYKSFLISYTPYADWVQNHTKISPHRECRALALNNPQT
jgi:hypothetical protein